MFSRREGCISDIFKGYDVERMSAEDVHALVSNYLYCPTAGLNNQELVKRLNDISKLRECTFNLAKLDTDEMREKYTEVNVLLHDIRGMKHYPIIQQTQFDLDSLFEYYQTSKETRDFRDWIGALPLYHNMCISNDIHFNFTGYAFQGGRLDTIKDFLLQSSSGSKLLMLVSSGTGKQAWAELFMIYLLRKQEFTGLIFWHIHDPGATPDTHCLYRFAVQLDFLFIKNDVNRFVNICRRFESPPGDTAILELAFNAPTHTDDMLHTFGTIPHEKFYSLRMRGAEHAGCDVIMHKSRIMQTNTSITRENLP
jgi:hypothetical protein